MAKKIECDGCGKIANEGGDIRPMEFRPRPGLGHPKAVWARDLCPSCVRQVRDPAEWPRVEVKA